MPPPPPRHLLRVCPPRPPRRCARPHLPPSPTGAFTSSLAVSRLMARRAAAQRSLRHPLDGLGPAPRPLTVEPYGRRARRAALLPARRAPPAPALPARWLPPSGLQRRHPGVSAHRRREAAARLLQRRRDAQGGAHAWQRRRGSTTAKTGVAVCRSFAARLRRRSFASVCVCCPVRRLVPWNA